MMKYTNCNLCGNRKTEILIPKEPSNIVECKRCGLIYKNPRLSEEQTLRHITFDRIAAEHKKVIWYYSKIKLFKKNLKRIEKYSSKGKLLDVGCGYGTFLKMAEERGWQTWGIEPSKSAYKYSKEKLGLNIFKGILKEANFSNDYFDTVTLWEVLEQVYNPLAELQEIKRILKKNGLIVLRLRNVTFHIFIYRFFRKLGNLAKRLNLKPTVFHLYNFSPKTIRKSLEKVGFEDIKIMPSEFTLGDPYSSGGSLSLFSVIVIKKVIFFLSKFIFYFSGGLLVVGPSILVFAKKP